MTPKLRESEIAVSSLKRSKSKLSSGELSSVYRLVFNLCSLFSHLLAFHMQMISALRLKCILCDLDVSVTTLQNYELIVGILQLQWLLNKD